MPNRRSMFKSLFAFTACVGALAAAGPAVAQSISPKIAADLAPVIGAASLPKVTWAKSLGGQAYAKVLIVARGSDPLLTGLRDAVLANNGSVYVIFNSVRAMAALVPVSALPALAARHDVLSIAPNRSTARTGSLVADATGASALPGYGSAGAFDGRGIGIAVLDSGIDWDHRNMLDAAGKTRVAQVVDVVGLNKAIVGTCWARGKDYSATLPLLRPEQAPQVSMIDDAYKIAMSRLGNQLRVAGTIELGGFDLALDTPLAKKRCALLVRRIEEVFPGVADTRTLEEGGDPQFWTGLRPATPTNIPLIGRTRIGKLWINAGHGTLGWTHGAGSGKALAELISGEVPAMDFGFVGLKGHARSRGAAALVSQRA